MLQMRLQGLSSICFCVITMVYKYFFLFIWFIKISHTYSCLMLSFFVSIYRLPVPYHLPTPRMIFKIEFCTASKLFTPNHDGIQENRAHQCIIYSICNSIRQDVAQIIKYIKHFSYTRGRYSIYFHIVDILLYYKLLNIYLVPAPNCNSLRIIHSNFKVISKY